MIKLSSVLLGCKESMFMALCKGYHGKMLVNGFCVTSGLKTTSKEETRPDLVNVLLTS